MLECISLGSPSRMSSLAKSPTTRSLASAIGIPTHAALGMLYSRAQHRISPRGEFPSCDVIRGDACCDRFGDSSHPMILCYSVADSARICRVREETPVWLYLDAPGAGAPDDLPVGINQPLFRSRRILSPVAFVAWNRGRVVIDIYSETIPVSWASFNLLMFAIEFVAQRCCGNESFKRESLLPLLDALGTLDTTLVVDAGEMVLGWTDCERCYQQ